MKGRLPEGVDMKHLGLTFALLWTIGGGPFAESSPSQQPSVPGSLAAKSEKDVSRQSWQWTTEERLSVRFDPEGMRSRRVADEAMRRNHDKSADGAPTPSTVEGENRCVVHGNMNPELLMPSELFGELVSLLFSEKPDTRLGFRALLEDRAQKAGIAAFDWSALETLLAPYELNRRWIEPPASRRQEASAERTRAQPSFEDFSRQQCSQRAAALEAARREYGRDRFDRFLYEVVAPMMSISGTTTAVELRRIEDGCR